MATQTAQSPTVAANKLRADLSLTTGAGLSRWTQPQAGAVARTVLQDLTMTIRPEHFGAVADGVTNDAPAIIAAIAAAVATRYPLIFSGKTYAVGAAITFDLTTTSYHGNGAILDFSTAPDGINCVTVLDGSLMKVHHTITGFDFRGRGPTSTQTGMLFEGPTTGTAGITAVSNCTWVNFLNGCRWGNNAFLQTFSQCYWRTCGICVLIPPGIADFAENISFHGCVFGTSTVHMDLAECEILLYGTSMDYASNGHMILRGAANVTMMGGHVEGSQDATYWINVTGADASASFYGTEIAVASSATKTAFPIGWSDTTAASAINFYSCEFTGINGTSYQLPYIVQGYGIATAPMYTLGGTGTTADAVAAISHTRLNLLVDGGFEDTALRDFYSVNTSTVSTSALDFRSGARSMRLAPAAGTVARAEFMFGVKPGDQPIFVQYLKGTGFVGDVIYLEMFYFDRAGNALGGGGNQTISSIPATFGRYAYRPNAQAPVGAAYGVFRIAKLSAALGNSDGNGALYVDDCYAQVYGSGGNLPLQINRPLRVAVTANTTFVIPSGFAIGGIKIQNTTANAVTGGVRIGTTGGAADVVASIAVGANADLFVPASGLLKQYFSSTAPQTLFLEAVTAWNAASLNISIVCSRVN